MVGRQEYIYLSPKVYIHTSGNKNCCQFVKTVIKTGFLDIEDSTILIELVIVKPLPKLTTKYLRTENSTVKCHDLNSTLHITLLVIDII